MENLTLATTRGEGLFTEINEPVLTYCLLTAIAFVVTIILIRSYMASKNSKNGKV